MLIRHLITGRRRRERRPLGIVLYSLLVLALPFYYYASAAGFSGERMMEYAETFRAVPCHQVVISVYAVVCAAGLFLVLRAGYILFLVLSLAFIFYNLYVFFTSADIFNVESVLLSFLTVSAFIYFTSREHSAPYIHGRTRGWRREVRRQLQHTVTVNGASRTIININSRGMLVRWRQSGLSYGDEVSCTLSVSGERFHINAAVVRTDSDSVAFAFRNMDTKIRRELYNALKDLEEEKAQAAQEF
ncbi:MAG: PilZ domain-containing protein [Spirochaetota bacterium]